MNTLLFIGGLGGWEVLLIVLIVLLLFGAKKIPELARGLGSGIKEFKNATLETNKEEETESTTESTTKSPTAATATPTTPPVENSVDNHSDEVKSEEAGTEEEKIRADEQPKQAAS